MIILILNFLHFALLNSTDGPSGMRNYKNKFSSDLLTKKDFQNPLLD